MRTRLSVFIIEYFTFVLSRIFYQLFIDLM